MTSHTTYRLTIALLAAALVAVAVGYYVHYRGNVRFVLLTRAMGFKINQQEVELKGLREKVAQQEKALVNYEAMLKAHEARGGVIRLSKAGVVPSRHVVSIGHAMTTSGKCEAVVLWSDGKTTLSVSGDEGGSCDSLLSPPACAPCPVTSP